MESSKHIISRKKPLKINKTELILNNLKIKNIIITESLTQDTIEEAAAMEKESQDRIKTEEEEEEKSSSVEEDEERKQLEDLLNGDVNP